MKLLSRWAISIARFSSSSGQTARMIAWTSAGLAGEAGGGVAGRGLVVAGGCVPAGRVDAVAPVAGRTDRRSVGQWSSASGVSWSEARGMSAPAGRQTERPGKSAVSSVAVEVEDRPAGCPIRQRVGSRSRRPPPRSRGDNRGPSTSGARHRRLRQSRQPVPRMYPPGGVLTSGGDGRLSRRLGRSPIRDARGLRRDSVGAIDVCGRWESCSGTDAVRTVSVSSESEVKPRNAGTSSVTITASPPNRASRGSTPDRGAGAGGRCAPTSPRPMSPPMHPRIRRLPDRATARASGGPAGTRPAVGRGAGSTE